MSNNLKNLPPDDPNSRKPIKAGPLGWAQLVVGLTNLLLRLLSWVYFLVTGEWPDWPLW